jgi:hypothetical protein
LPATTSLIIVWATDNYTSTYGATQPHSAQLNNQSC